MGTSPNTGNEHQCGGGQQLPPDNGAYRLAQVAEHGFEFFRPLQNARSIAFAYIRVNLLQRGNAAISLPYLSLRSSPSSWSRVE